jgi:ribonuclease T2
MEVIDYFARTVALFRSLDVYTALQQGGIVPDDSYRYALADIRSTLERLTGGGQVTLQCHGPEKDVLYEIRFAYWVKGSLQTGEFIPAKAEPASKVDKPSNCADTVRYLPKRIFGDEL